MPHEVSESDKASLERLVAERAPPARFARVIPNRREAAGYFATAHARQNPPDSAGRCLVCENLTAPTTTTFRWVARFTDGISVGVAEVLLLALGHVGVKVKYTLVTFDTFHPTCASCGASLRLQRGIANVLNFVGLFLVVVAGTVLAICASGYFYFDRPAERTEMLIGTGWSAGATVIGLLCLWQMWRLRVPAHLRYLARRPFKFGSAKWIR